MSFINIKNLIKKDLALLMHPTVFIFFALAACMLFIPSYPRPVGFFYILIGIMNIFTLDLQYKDHEASGLLPVKKRESVLSRLLTVVCLELAQLAVTIPFAFLAGGLHARIGEANPAGMNINITLYSICLLGYAAYNIIVIPGAYRGQFKIYVRSFVGMLAYSAISLGLENLVCRPQGGGLTLNGTGQAELLAQLPFLAGAAAVFIAVNLITFIIASRFYEGAEI